MKKKSPNPASIASMLPFDTTLFHPGDRVCVAVSGGADSTALLRALLEQREQLGIVLSVLHVEHGLRGASAARDAAFVATLAEALGLPCEVLAVDTPKRVAEQKESIEEAARNLRYQVFRDVLDAGKADKIATAHTLDDQAETVLMKLLRGAWTEGLSGIHPVLEMESRPQVCVRPLLGATRAQVETYLQTLGQDWCEDESNRSPAYTRNRVRHDLLPVLREYNPRISDALAAVAANARAEEQHWRQELARVLPQLLLPGKPVRGGGRSVATAPGTLAFGLEVVRLQALDPGLLRRVLRAVAKKCGATLDFEATECLAAMTTAKLSVVRKRLELPGKVRVERSARELQFERKAEQRNASVGDLAVPEYELPIPGVVEAPAFRARYAVNLDGADLPAGTNATMAKVRAWRPGDRVELVHSSGPKKVKEVLERMGIRGEERALWPVIVCQGRIVWMRGVALVQSGELASLRITEARIEESF